LRRTGYMVVGAEGEGGVLRALEEAAEGEGALIGGQEEWQVSDPLACPTRFARAWRWEGGLTRH
jgi:hypothetical protein